MHYAAIIDECVIEVSSREEEYSIHGPVSNFRNFQVLVRKIIQSWDGISQHPNMSKFSTESDSKTAITALNISKVYHIFALYLHDIKEALIVQGILAI